MFQVGDKVICIDDSPCAENPYPGAPWGIAKGSIWAVEDVWLDNDLEETIALSSIENYGTEMDGRWEGYTAVRFRKIQPCEPEFIELLKRIKPKVDA